MFFCFFFQAEDGIRDLYVTGVQTCALPISKRLLRTLDLTSVLDEILSQIQDAFGYPICAVFFVDEQTRELHVKAQRGYDPVDRKSTRLNSSHVEISYAVFCLKKKKSNNV